MAIHPQWRRMTRQGRQMREDLALLRALAGQRAARVAVLTAERNRLLDRLSVFEGHFSEWEAEIGHRDAA